MTRALVTQMLNALEHHQSQTRPIHKTEFAITAAREYLETEPSGERAELIAKLRTGWTVMEESEFERLDDLCREAADMLEADADLRTQLARRTVERDMAISMIGDCIDEQQATTPALRECWYESNELKVCRKCGQMHDKAIAAQGEKP